MLAGFAASLIAGCAASPYRYGLASERVSTQEPATHVPIEVGHPTRAQERLAAVVDFPHRILPFLPARKSRELSDETAGLVQEYLSKNQLNQVYVSTNHYDPS